MAGTANPKARRRVSRAVVVSLLLAGMAGPIAGCDTTPPMLQPVAPVPSLTPAPG